MIFAHESAAAAGQAGAPVLGGADLFEFVGLADVLQTLIDELPGTIDVGSDFTALCTRAAAGTI